MGFEKWEVNTARFRAMLSAQSQNEMRIFCLKIDHQKVNTK